MVTGAGGGGGHVTTSNVTTMKIGTLRVEFHNFSHAYVTTLDA